MNAAEEARAAAYRAEQQARAADRAARARALAGSPSARAALTEAWRPWSDQQPSPLEPTRRSDPPTNAD